MRHATGGLADVRVVRAAETMAFAPHNGELVFGFVLGGTARLEHGGDFELGPADAFVIPPGEPWSLGAPSDDFELLHVTTARLDVAA
jgi:quercetin dioxygenase-like cupin family protein